MPPRGTSPDIEHRDDTSICIPRQLGAHAVKSRASPGPFFRDCDSPVLLCARLNEPERLGLNGCGGGCHKRNRRRHNRRALDGRPGAIYFLVTSSPCRAWPRHSGSASGITCCLGTRCGGVPRDQSIGMPSSHEICEVTLAIPNSWRGRFGRAQVESGPDSSQIEEQPWLAVAAPERR